MALSPSGRAVLARRVRVAATLVRHGVGGAVDRVRARGRDPQRASAARLRRALEDLGPAFVKLGQLLSTRGDLLPPAYQEELARLQDAAPPEPPGTVEAVIEHELGRPVHELFDRFDPIPMAAASIGQAHIARLPGEHEVVVKVRRPRAVAQVELDLHLLLRTARTVSALVPGARRRGVVPLAEELARTLRAELDYRVEAANAERFARNFAGDENVHVPVVHRAVSTARVITLERIEGVKVSDLDGLRAAGFDLPTLARRVVDTVLVMVFEHGFFHADPHPGNLFVEPGGRLGLVDFGMVGALDLPTRARLGRLFVAVAAANATSLADELLGFDTATRPVDRPRLTRDLDELLATVTSAPLAELRIGPLLQAVMAVARRHRLRLPPELALLVRTAAMTEALAAMLDPDLLLVPAFAPYAARLAMGGQE